MRLVSYLVFGILAVLLVLTFMYESGSNFAPCVAWGSFIGGGMHGMHGYGFGFPLRGLIFWILLALLIYLLIDKRESKEDAIDILNRRLARGEITKEEYIALKREIQKK